MTQFYRLTFTTFFASVFFLVSIQETNAQDPRYTQYYNSPLRLNPALNGVFEGTWRVGANFRTQWGSVMNQPYSTIGLNADLKTPVFKSDYFAVSFSAMTDISGQGMYNVTDINLGVSYMKKLSGGGRSYRPAITSYLVAGAQLGIGQRSVKWLNFTYSRQWDVNFGNTGGYNTNLSSGENSGAMRMTKIYPDLSAGLLWYGVMGRRKSVYAGAGIYHLNRPEISQFNRNVAGVDIERLYMRITAHAGGEMLLGGRGAAVSLLPGFVGMFQGPSMELNMGLGVKYQGAKYDDFALKFSLWTRLANRLDRDIDADALMLIIGLDWQSFQFGISYDINLSSLTAVSNGQGALEFSIIYIHDVEKSRQQGCPSF